MPTKIALTALFLDIDRQATVSSDRHTVAFSSDPLNFRSYGESPKETFRLGPLSFCSSQPQDNFICGYDLTDHFNPLRLSFRWLLKATCLKVYKLHSVSLNLASNIYVQSLIRHGLQVEEAT